MTSADERPNVLIVLLDDAGVGDAGILGHPLLRTPNIDRFGAASVRFSAAYSGAPNCSPSRAALLTGRTPYRTGVYDFLSKKTGDMHLSEDEVTIAAVLQTAGYATAHVGKWHLSRGRGAAPPSKFGFEHSNGSYAQASELVPALGGWLRAHRRGRPFFAYLALWEPHEPVELWSPPRYRRLYGSRPPPESPRMKPKRNAKGRSWAEGSSHPPPDASGIIPTGDTATDSIPAGAAPKVGIPVEEAAADTIPEGGAASTDSIPVGGASPPIDSLASLVAGAGGGGACAWRLPTGARGPARVYYGCISQVLLTCLPPRHQACKL